ncbi:MAG: hypothetical protein ABS81_00580 [Pseudonocardia sp. SCN 72-86]|nr:MAG: hypothetical protein ABS81_00580 [Pseudonocardia sp. SCN 72-86]
MPPVERLATDLWSIPVPMPPISPLRYVSVYVLTGDSGVTLIDAGWDSDEAWDALRGGLAELGASIADVRGCLVTHQHFDHIGLARRIREDSDAWIALHPADRDVIIAPDFRDRLRASDADVRWLVRLGAGAEEAERLRGRHQSGGDVRGTFALPDRLVEDGDVLELPGWLLRAVHTPGHTPGHLCFAAPHRRLFFAGDHVLPRISPNITADRRPGVDALGDFLTSLEKVAGEDVDEVLPAHEWRFRGLSDRTNQLRAHHEARLAELVEVIAADPGGVPWDFAGGLTWSRSWDQYDGHMRVSAVNETAAHLVHLVERGVVVASDDDVPRYRLAHAHGLTVAADVGESGVRG